jgi:hypothetical protein
MKAKLFGILLVLLLCTSPIHAQETDPFSEFFDDTNERIEQEGSAFVDASRVVGKTGPGALNTVFGAFDPGYCGEDHFTVSSGWISLTFFALIIVAFGIAIVYMLGQVMQSSNLIATAKEEGFQALLTVIRVVFIFGVLFAANQWYSLKTSGSDDPIYKLKSTDPTNVGGSLTIIDGAMAFSRQLIVEMITDYSNLVMYNMVLHTIFSSTMWFGVSWRAMYSFNLGPVLKPLIDIVGMALQFLSLGIGEWMLHLVLLCLLKKWTWTLFIPIGIFMRSIPQTRGAGEALFAIIFALALIYPFMFLVTYETHKILGYNLVEGKSALSSFVKQSGVLAVGGAVVATMFLAAGVFFPFFIGMGLNLAIELVKNAIYYIIIMSLLLPFLNIFITLTAAKEIARFFSVDVSFMSFIKVI